MYFCKFSSLIVAYMLNVSNGLCVHMVCYLNNLSVFRPLDIDFPPLKLPSDIKDTDGSKQPSDTKK